MYDYTYYDYGYGYDYGYNYGSTLGSILEGLAILLMIISLIALAVGIVQLIAQWKLYKKAGKGGWEAIVPFYTNWVLVEIAGLKWYWFLGFFAPMVFEFIGLGVIGWLAYLFTLFNIFYNLSKRFNKGIGFAICATLFTPIGIAILGFSQKAVYDKNVAVSPHGVFGTPESNNQSVAQPAYQQPVQPTAQPVEQVTPVQPVTESTTVIPVPEVQQIVEPSVTPVVNRPTPSFCTNCGNALVPDAKFCTNCGKQI